MSLTRSLLNEFRPLFQLLDDPFYNTDPFQVTPRDQQAQRDREQSNAVQSLFWGPGGAVTRSPHVHMTDEADRFVVEAELPGVPKENLDISIGDNGRSLTIKGSASSFYESPDAQRTGQQAQRPAPQTPVDSQQASATPNTSAEVARQSQQGQPQQYHRWSSRSSFARTIWLPRPVDGNKVTAKLDHGVLTLEIPKLQAATQRITLS